MNMANFIVDINQMNTAHLPLHNDASLFHSLFSCSATSQTTEEKTFFYFSAAEQNNVYCQIVLNTKQNHTYYVAFITKLTKQTC